MVDSAFNNHQRKVRLEHPDQLVFPDYTQDNDRWICILDYQHADWQNLVLLWKSFNFHIVHLKQSINPSRLENNWTDYKGSKVILSEMIKGCPEHLTLHVNDIKNLI
jgi:hypothetical protein